MYSSEDARFDTAVLLLGRKLSCPLLSIPAGIKRKVQEVRLRAGYPVVLGCGRDVYFLSLSGRLCCAPGKDVLQTTPEEITECFHHLCGYSVYSHEKEICQGFISLQGGHRAGISGTAVLQEGKIHALRNISSICLRISREYPGCASAVFDSLTAENLRDGLLLAGPPSSGKTTVLRDIARQLSSGCKGPYCRVALVDERGELAGMHNGVPGNDLGPCCDILNGYPKSQGALQAVRSLSPEIIVCDEIGTEDEVLSLLQCFHSGVGIIASIHASSPRELLKKQQAIQLLKAGAFRYAAFLKGREAAGKIYSVCEMRDLFDQMDRDDSAGDIGRSGRIWEIA